MKTINLDPSLCDDVVKANALDLLKDKGLGKVCESSVYEQEADRQLEVIADSNRTLGLSTLQLIGEAGFKASQGVANETKDAIKLAAMRMEVAAALAAVKYQSDFLVG